MNEVNQIILEYYTRASDLTIQSIIRNNTGQRISPEEIRVRYDILKNEAK